MNTPIVHAQVAEYVRAVRAQLDDLSADEVDELTGGLEADLDDALGDSGADGRGPAEIFGPPADYAAELRTAAGLPARPAAPTLVLGQTGLRARARRRGAALADRVRAHPRWPAVRDFLLTVRPVWWVTRAVLATAVLAGIFGVSGFAGFCLLLLAVVVSVELGRRRTATTGRWPRRLIAAGNTLAVVLLPFFLAALPGPGAAGPQVIDTGKPPQNGLWVNGAEVYNVFPYDAQGRPLSGVQLYDQAGRPLEVGDAARGVVDTDGKAVTQVPASDGSGGQRWNVFPLRQLPQTYDDNGELRDDPGGPTAASPPSAFPGAIVVTSASPTPSGSPTP